MEEKRREQEIEALTLSTALVSPDLQARTSLINNLIQNLMLHFLLLCFFESFIKGYWVARLNSSLRLLDSASKSSIMAGT